MIEQAVNCPVLLVINRVDNTPEQLKHLNDVVLSICARAPKIVQNVHYLPKEMGANFSIMQYVDKFMESVIKFGVLMEIEKDQEIDYQVSSYENTSDDQS